MFEHYILTRFNTQLDDNGLLLYDKPGADEWMETRMVLFERTKESVLSQNGNFNWVVSLDERTPDRFLNEIFTDERMILTHLDIRHPFLEGEIKPKTDWVITTRLDNDDRYFPGFVTEVQGKFEPKLKVIDVAFYQLEEATDKLYVPRRKKWPASMYISLVEPKERVMTAFCRPHGQVFGEYPTEGDYKTGLKNLRKIGHSYINKPLAMMVCHGTNMTNAIDGEYLKML